MLLQNLAAITERIARKNNPNTDSLRTIDAELHRSVLQEQTLAFMFCPGNPGTSCSMHWPAESVVSSGKHPRFVTSILTPRIVAA